jgi:hypothetical protein
MENPLKDCLTIQVREEDVNSPDFDISNYMNKKIKEAFFKKALEFEQTQYHFPFNNVNGTE